MSKTTTLSAALTLALATTPALAQSAAGGPEFLPNTGSTTPFSRAVQVGDTLYLAGQLGLPRRATEIEQTPTDETPIQAETRRAMDRIGETLAEYGLAHDALFKCTVWLAEIDDFAAFNDVYRTYFEEGRYPTRSTMAVKALAAGARIEIECMAHNPVSLSGPKIAWERAEMHFLSGEVEATNVYTREEASACVGRWRLHADAVDDGAFPFAALEAFPNVLRLNEAIASARFFMQDENAQGIMRSASDEAEARLRKALAGDRQAFEDYFKGLGLCYSRPESAGDGVIGSSKDEGH